MKHICIFTGARPNFVKVAPLIRAIQNTQDCEYKLVYAGREDDPTLEATLFSDLQMPRPDVFMNVDCQNLNELTGMVMSAFEHYLDENQTDTVIVVDDLASTMAAAIVAKKRGKQLAHLVAGTRSFDINMPKEINRLVIDGLSDMLFTAGIGSSSVATREGAEMQKIYLVGNILMDSLRANYPRWQQPQCVTTDRYLVFTLNRKALMADETKLFQMLDAICAEAGEVPVIAPLRGQARELVEKHGKARESAGKARETVGNSCEKAGIHVVDPLSYLQFGWLTSHAAGIITDSGNVAEEATFNNVPCITLNSYTEHQETVKLGTNVLVGEDSELLRQTLRQLLQGQWKKSSLPDRWDGRTAERIVRILMEN